MDVNAGFLDGQCRGSAVGLYGRLPARRERSSAAQYCRVIISGGFIPSKAPRETARCAEKSPLFPPSLPASHSSSATLPGHDEIVSCVQHTRTCGSCLPTIHIHLSVGFAPASPPLERSCSRVQFPLFNPAYSPPPDPRLPVMSTSRAGRPRGRPIDGRDRETAREERGVVFERSNPSLPRSQVSAPDNLAAVAESVILPHRQLGRSWPRHREALSPLARWHTQGAANVEPWCVTDFAAAACTRSATRPQRQLGRSRPRHREAFRRLAR